jgi:hypothetical protein
MSELWKVPDEFRDYENPVMLKVLVAAGMHPPYRTEFLYEKPRRRGDRWYPSPWTKTVLDPIPCKRGYHLTLQPNRWDGDSVSNRLWWAEGQGSVSASNEGGAHKVAFGSVRILRPVTLQDFLVAGPDAIKSIHSMLGKKAMSMALAARYLGQYKSGERFQGGDDKKHPAEETGQVLDLLRKIRTGARLSQSKLDIAQNLYGGCGPQHFNEAPQRAFRCDDFSDDYSGLVDNFSAACRTLDLHTAKPEWRRGKIRPKGV